MMMNKQTYFLTLSSVPMKHKNDVVAYTHFPYIRPFKSDLKSLQNEVGGLIEHFSISSDLADQRIDMWIDDEGKFKDYKPTFLLCDQDGNPLDVILGNCVFTRNDGPETIGLSDQDITTILEWLGTLPFVPVRQDQDGALEYAFVVKGFSSFMG